MNNDLISRSALLRIINTMTFDRRFSLVKPLIEATPTIDAEPVIRCKNCKHYEGGVCRHIAYIMDGYYRNTYEVKSPDDFCSIGERLDAEVSE